MTPKHDHPRTILNEVMFELFACVFVIVVVLTLWSNPFVALVALAVGIVLQRCFWKEKVDGAVMAIAALVGAPAEILCVKSGLWSYRAPGLVFGVPIWLPLVWAYLICLFRRISLSIYMVLHSAPSDDENAAFSGLFPFLKFLILVYFLATVLVIDKKIAITFSLFMGVMAIFRHRRKDVLLFITGAILGTFGEFLCMQLGFWHYHKPTLKAIGLPVSLPLAWGLSSIIIVSLAEQIQSGTTHLNKK